MLYRCGAPSVSVCPTIPIHLSLHSRAQTKTAHIAVLLYNEVSAHSPLGFTKFAVSAEVIIGFTQSDVSVTEGSGMVTLNVSVLSGDFAMPIYVNFSTTSGTAFGTETAWLCCKPDS